MEQDRTTSFQIGRKIVCENLEIFLREGKYFLTRETENRLQMCTRVSGACLMCDLVILMLESSTFEEAADYRLERCCPVTNDDIKGRSPR